MNLFNLCGYAALFHGEKRRLSWPSLDGSGMAPIAAM